MTSAWLAKDAGWPQQWLALRSLECQCRFCHNPVAFKASDTAEGVEAKCCRWACVLPAKGLGSDWCERVRRDLSDFLVFPATP